MILNPGQAQRFCRLYGALLAYADRRLGVTRHAADPTGVALDEREQLQVAHALWRDLGLRSLVEDFVLENPADLPRADLKEALAWKGALWGPCVVLRDGNDTLFLHDEYAFAVRGLNTEVDQLLKSLPTFVNAVLLPFDGLITYGVSLEEYRLDMSGDMAATAERDVRTMRARGHVVSTATEFGAVAPRVDERRLAREAERFALQMELDMNADELAPGQHRGPLAGLSWEQREMAVAEHVRPGGVGTDSASAATSGTARQLMLSVADDLCVPGDPTDTLVDVLSHFDEHRLAAAARVLGICPPSGSPQAADAPSPPPTTQGAPDSVAANPISHSAQAVAFVHPPEPGTTPVPSPLASVMAARIPRDADALLRPARLDGIDSLLSLQRLQASDGRIDVAEAEVTSLADLAKPVFPLSFLFHAKGAFTSVMPREVRHALADVDWDAELDRALAIEEALHFVDLLVDLCGIVAIEDAIAGYESYFEDHADTADVVEAVLHAADAGTACFELLELDGTPYLVDYEAVRPPSVESGDVALARLLRGRPSASERTAARTALAVAVDPTHDSAEAHDRHREDVARRLLVAHGRRAPRPLTDELLACEDVATWVLRQHPAQALTAYLDAHVPDGADDYRFADRVVERIVAASRDVIVPTTVIEYLRAEGLVPTDAQLLRLLDLVADLTSSVPKWSNNGWPPLDVVAPIVR